MARLLVWLICLIPLAAAAQQADSIEIRKSFAIYPAFAFQPETSLQMGIVGIWALESYDQSQNDFLRQSTFTPFFLYTLRNQILTELNLDYYFSNGNNLNITPSFFNFPDIYFGIGNDTDPDINESYTNLFAQLQGQFFVPINSSTFYGLAFDFHETRITDKKENGLLRADNLVGANGGSIYAIGPAFRYETRDNIIYPSQGAFISVQMLINAVGDFDYQSYALDVRKYVSTKNQKHVFAWQLNARLNTGSDIPFYKLPQLGGNSRLRGISNASLYRDQQALFSQFEYRTNLFWRFGMVAFAGAGDVASRLDELRLSEFKYVVGTGIRFAVLPKQKLNFRFDFGFSNGGQSAFYVGMREAF